MIGGSLWAFAGFGLWRQDLILFIVGLVGLTLSLWCLLATVIGALRVFIALRDPPPAPTMEIECGRPARLPFSAPSLWGLPFITVDWRWQSPSVDFSRTDGHDRIVPGRRGVVSQIVREVEIGDVFGVALVRFRHIQPASMRFVPSTGALRDVQVVHGLAGGEQLGHPEGEPVGDRIDMRRYGEGDPIRYVLWKVYARRRELMVRTPERAFSPARQTIAYLVTGPDDPAAAGAARVAVESGAMGQDWSLGVDGASQIAESAPQAMDLIVRSAETAANDGGSGLHSFLRAADVQTGRRAMVFVPAKPGPWLDRVAAAAGDERLEFFVCVDGVSRKKPRTSLLKRWLFELDSVADRPQTDWEGLQTVLRELHQSGGRITVVDRAAGRVFPADQLRQW